MVWDRDWQADGKAGLLKPQILGYPSSMRIPRQGGQGGGGGFSERWQPQHKLYLAAVIVAAIAAFICSQLGLSFHF